MDIKAIIISVIISICAGIYFSFLNPLDPISFGGLTWLIPTIVTILSVLLMILSILYLFFSNVFAIYPDKSKMPKIVKILINNGDDQQLIQDFMNNSKKIFYCLIALFILHFSNLLELVIFIDDFAVYVGLIVEVFILSQTLIVVFYSFDLFKELLEATKQNSESDKP